MSSTFLLHYKYRTKYTGLRTWVFHTVNFSQSMVWPQHSHSAITMTERHTHSLHHHHVNSNPHSSSHHSPSKSSWESGSAATSSRASLWMGASCKEHVFCAMLSSPPCTQKSCLAKSKESKFLDKLHTVRKGNNHSFQWCSSFDLNAVMLSIKLLVKFVTGLRQAGSSAAWRSYRVTPLYWVAGSSDTGKRLKGN